jgi:hypothetical protein
MSKENPPEIKPAPKEDLPIVEVARVPSVPMEPIKKVVLMPDVAKQFEKTPAYIEEEIEFTFPEGTPKAGEKTMSKLQTPVYDDKDDEIIFQGKTEKVKKRLMLSDLVALASDPNNKALSDQIAATFNPKGAENLKAELQKKAYWGLGCPHGCGEYYEFKPTEDLNSFEFCNKDLVRVAQLQEASDGSFTFTCPKCRLLIEVRAV